jgi:hypothetical protein
MGKGVQVFSVKLVKVGAVFLCSLFLGSIIHQQKPDATILM